MKPNYLHEGNVTTKLLFLSSYLDPPKPWLTAVRPFRCTEVRSESLLWHFRVAQAVVLQLPVGMVSGGLEACKLLVFHLRLRPLPQVSGHASDQAGPHRVEEPLPIRTQSISVAGLYGNNSAGLPLPVCSFNIWVHSFLFYSFIFCVFQNKACFHKVHISLYFWRCYL